MYGWVAFEELVQIGSGDPSVHVRMLGDRYWLDGLLMDLVMNR